MNQKISQFARKLKVGGFGGRGVTQNSKVRTLIEWCVIFKVLIK